MKERLRLSLDNSVLSTLQATTADRAGRHCRRGSQLWVRVWYEELCPVILVPRAEFGPELAQLGLWLSFQMVPSLLRWDHAPQICIQKIQPTAH